MKTNNFEFIPYSFSTLKDQIGLREGETKLGQTIGFDYTDNNIKYVIVGISEDIGPQANLGFPGAFNGFQTFLSRFINIQDNRFLSGKSICIHGEIKQKHPFSSIQEARNIIKELDELVVQIISPIIQSGKIPIVIGGGHNNAFPLIKSAFLKENKQQNIINLDPHADCRPLEGRHSGNPFSFATQEGMMHSYTVFGLHQQYNSEYIYDFLEKNSYLYTFFEDYLFNGRDLQNDLNAFLEKSINFPTGIELDIDSIAFMPSSAFTPSGFTLNEARTYLNTLAKHTNISYLHIPESAPTNVKEEKIIGKALSYLVSDFIKSNKKLDFQ